MSPTVVPATSILNAQELRIKMTNGERRLWSELRQFRRIYNLHVRKQVPIGPYIADFAIHSLKVIIELDGEFHFEPKGLAKDKIRDAWFERRGYKVVRMNTGELADNFGGCIEHLLHELGVMHD